MLFGLVALCASETIRVKCWNSGLMSTPDICHNGRVVASNKTDGPKSFQRQAQNCFQLSLIRLASQLHFGTASQFLSNLDVGDAADQQWTHK